MRKTGLLIGEVLCILVVSGCSFNKIQAPYDSFVCFNASFNHCLDDAQQGQLRTFQSKTYVAFRQQQSANPPQRSPIPPDQPPPDISTKDSKYTCAFGKVPYVLDLDADAKAAVVFVSPLLLRQIGEQQLRLDKVRTACSRLVDAYNFQLDIIKLQDQLSKAQKGIALFSAEIEKDRNARDGFGARGTNASEADLCSASPGIILRECLFSDRAIATSVGEQLRGDYKAQTTDVDYKKLFEDANLATDLQLRELYSAS